MFFVLVSFMLSTVMAARAHLDLQMSRYDGLELERDLAARGASARALVALNQDDDWKDHDTDNRVLFQSMQDGRFNVEGWAQQDPDNPLIYHVFGRAFTDGVGGQESISSRVVLRRPDVEGVTFTNAPRFGRLLPDSLFYKRGYDSEWSHLPPAPRVTYDDNMQIVNHGGYCGSLFNLASDDAGRLYAHYVPGYDRSDFVGSIFRQKYQDFLVSGDFAGMYRAMPDYVELLGYGLRKKAFGGSVIMRFDTAQGDWQPLPAVPDVGFANGQAYIDPNNIYDGGVGAIEVANNSLYTTLYKDGHDGMMRLDLSTNQWEIIQPPGGMPEAGQCEADEQGNLYARWATMSRNQSAIFRKSGNNDWEVIPEPPKGQFDDNNVWQPLPGTVTDMQHMDVTPDGKVYGVWNAHEANSSHEYVIYEFSKDDSGVERWKPIPPAPRFTYEDGEVKALDGAAQLLKAMAVDSEGRIISSIDEDKGIDTLAFKQGDEDIAMSLLPFKAHTTDGTFVEDTNKNLEPFQAEGGGFQNGSEDRYIPVYRY
jgi:hypothetical protein